ncbi:MAG: aspartyl protease family protein, partial [Limisphaerales bacterium]
MKPFVILPNLALVLALSFLCSCAAPPRSQTPLIVPLSHVRAVQLPAAAPMNKDAGRGNWIFLTVRLADGQALPFVLDTGAFSTLLDKSLEPKLGRRIDSGTLRVFGAAHRMNQYQAPALYLGRTRLMMTGPYIFTDNLKRLSDYAGRPVLGMIGMDILAHYCVQFDFVANKVRFLDDRRP